jgi:hypothetical protein
VTGHARSLRSGAGRTAIRVAAAVTVGAAGFAAGRAADGRWPGGWSPGGWPARSWPSGVAPGALAVVLVLAAGVAAANGLGKAHSP